MKILMITKPMAPPWDDSAKNMARDIVFAAPERKFQLLSIPDYRIGTENACEEPFYSDVKSGYAPDLSMKMRIFARILRPDKVDLVHLFFQPNPLTLRMSRYALAMKSHTKCIHTLTCAPGNFEKSAPLLFADSVVTVSKWTARQLEAHGVNHVSCVYPCAETSPSGDCSAARDKLGLPGNGPLALFAGDLESDAMIERLVRILEGIKGSGLRLIAACRDKTEATPIYKSRLKHLAEEAGAGDSLILLGRVDNMPALFDSVDFQIFPSDSLYGKMDLPLVLLEGMGRGVPVLLSELPPLAELLPDERAGRIIAADDAGTWVAAMLQWASDRQLLKSASDAARETVAQEFSRERLGREYETLYRELEDNK